MTEGTKGREEKAKALQQPDKQLLSMPAPPAATVITIMIISLTTVELVAEFDGLI